MGHRVEDRIANAVKKNPRLMKLGISLEFKVSYLSIFSIYLSICSI